MISYLPCESTTKENAKRVPCSVLSLTVVFVKFFPLIEVRSILEKNTFFFLLYIKLSRFPCIWPFREIIVFFLKASIVKLQSWCNSALYSLSGLSRWMWMSAMTGKKLRKGMLNSNFFLQTRDPFLLGRHSWFSLVALH